MQPKSIQREGKAVAILWSDDHRSVYEIEYLRKKCPCVACKNSAAPESQESVELPTFREGPPLEIRSSEPVGRYALKFAFSDGHDTGIYSFQHLREICPCPDCAPTQFDLKSKG